MRKCTVETCNKKHEAKGYCQEHYLRMHRYGSLDPRFSQLGACHPPRKCKIEGCKKKHESKGYCRTHGYNNAKYGNPIRIAETLKERLSRSTIIISPSDCHLWTGALIKKGYGVMLFRGGHRYAHRSSYEVYKGEIPKGMFVCHSCDVRNCINPSHLWLGTAKDNSQDMIKKGRRKIGYRNLKLTSLEVMEIRKLAGQFSHKEIGLMFNVSASNIGSIINRKTWIHI